MPPSEIHEFNALLRLATVSCARMRSSRCSRFSTASAHATAQTLSSRAGPGEPARRVRADIQGPAFALAAIGQVGCGPCRGAESRWQMRSGCLPAPVPRGLRQTALLHELCSFEHSAQDWRLPCVLPMYI